MVKHMNYISIHQTTCLTWGVGERWVNGRIEVYGTPPEEHIRTLAEQFGIKHCLGEPGDVQG